LATPVKKHKKHYRRTPGKIIQTPTLMASRRYRAHPTRSPYSKGLKLKLLQVPN